jgi:HSP20 family protein
LDLYETEDHYVLNAELPGVDGQDIRIEVMGSELSIRGERRHTCSSESYHRLEGFRGSFHRTFSLPESLSNAKITATLEDGLLQVTLGKSEKTGKRPTGRRHGYADG